MVTLTNQSDVYDGGSGADIVDGGNGADVLNGGDGADQLSGGNGSDTLNGGTGDDILHGDNGDDTLDGGEGADHVFGDKGNDRLIYVTQADAQENDVYDGGLGTDTLVIDLNNMTLPEDYADSAALKQAITDYFNSHLGQTMDFSSFGIGLTATNMENLIIVGDAVPPPIEHTVLARAWIDANGDHVYQAGTDIEIFRVEDTNDNGSIGAGDHLFLNKYPTDIENPTANLGEIRGAGVDEYVIDSGGASSNQMTVFYDGFAANLTVDELVIPSVTIAWLGVSTLELRDSFNNVITAGGPDFTPNVVDTSSEPGNQNFVDILIV